MAKLTDFSLTLMKSPGKIFVIDDDPDTLASLSVLFQMVGWPTETFLSVDDFLARCNSNLEGCIISEANMPDMSGPVLQEKLSRRHIKIPILFQSDNGTISMAAATMRLGAIDFLTKPAPAWLLIKRVEEAIQKSRDVVQQEENWRQASNALAELTPRESEIMRLIVEGHSNKKIAQILAISDRTVENHRAHIMSKTKAGNLLALARMALEADEFRLT